MQSPPRRAAKDLFLHVADEADRYYNAWRFHVKQNLCSHWLQRSVGRRMLLSWSSARMRSGVSFISRQQRSSAGQKMS